MATSNAYSFTRTGRTWGVLLLAAIAWLIVSLWAYRVAAKQIEPHVTDAAAFERKGQDQASVGAARETEELEITKRETAERQAAESELVERKAAEGQAAEIELVEREAAESAAAARVAADQTRVASEQRVAEQREAVEQADQAAKQSAELQARQIAQEALAAQNEHTLLQKQQMALAEKNQALEQARLAARLAAEHQIRLRAQNESSMEVAELSVDYEPQQVQAEQEGQVGQEALAEREAQAEQDAQAERDAENAREAAAEEARRVAADSARISAYEHLRQEETGALVGLSESLQFQSRSEVIDREFEQILDRVFEPLFLYAEMPVVISVSTNEYRGLADNNRLSRDRARSIVAYLVSRGLQEERFDIQAGLGEGLPYGSHRVRVSVEGPIQ